MTDDPQQRPPLDYRDPREDAPPPHFLAQAFGCAALTAVLLVGAVAALLYFVFFMDYRGAHVPSGWAGGIIALCVAVAMVVTLLIVAQRAYRDPATRGWAFGIWIGFGIAISVEGICFATR